MRILITGSEGFIGSNLSIRLREAGYLDVVGISETTPRTDLVKALEATDFVFHLAGVNRPKDEREFVEGNVDFTAELCSILTEIRRPTPVAFTSSIQAVLDNPYGLSKRAAEEVLLAYSLSLGAPVFLFRLPNVFGKWSRPNYNSVVATFCHNISRGLSIKMNDPNASLRLVYVDDVIAAFLHLLESPNLPGGFIETSPTYDTTVGEVARILQEFSESRGSLMTPRVGTGMVRALYSTYLSHLPPESFSYGVKCHVDPRGEFVEMLKTPDCGQFSYFTAHPGVTRGDHYHHSKTEKFMILRGSAQFRFRHILSGEFHEFIAKGGEGRIIETVPGWTHNITNIGQDELIVMLWANEIFDPSKPDTIPMRLAF